VWSDSIAGTFASSRANEFNVRATGGIRIYTNSSYNSGVTVFAGDSGWNSLSDRSSKSNFAPVDPDAVLNGLMSLPITTWSYRAREDIRHMGPTAQDFRAAFGALGGDDRRINSLDADGVALAAIQGLYRKVEAENAALKERNADLELRLQRLEALVAANGMTRQASSAPPSH
jgi:hypothetical protein